MECSPVLLATPFRPSFGGGGSLDGPSSMTMIGDTATQPTSQGSAPGLSTAGQLSPISPTFSGSTPSTALLTSSSAAPPLAREQAPSPEVSHMSSEEAHVKGPLERATVTMLGAPEASASGLPSSPPAGDAAGPPPPSTPRDPRKDAQAVPAPQPGFPVLPDLGEGGAQPSSDGAIDRGSRSSPAPGARRGAPRGRAPRRQPTVTVVEHEVDGGAYVELSPGMRREVLPPVYDPAWILGASAAPNGAGVPPRIEPAGATTVAEADPARPLLAQAEEGQSAANNPRAPMPLRVETLSLDHPSALTHTPGGDDGAATPLSSATDNPYVASNAPLWLF